MDIAALSTSMSMSALMDEVSVRVLSMSMDNTEVLADGMQKALEMSVNPDVGGNIDVSL